MKPLRTRPALLLLFLLVLAPLGLAQPPGKRPVTHKDYANWRSLQGSSLSPDGTLLVYGAAPQEGDGQMVLRDSNTGREWNYPRGQRPAAGAATPATGRRGGPAASPSIASFSPDSRHVVFTLYPSKAERDKADKAGKPGPAPEAPRTALGVVDCGTGKLTRIEKVRSFQMPEEGPAVLAYVLEPKRAAGPEKTSPESPAPEKGRLPGGRPGGKGRAGGAAGATRPQTPIPGELVIRHLPDGRERTIADVTEYSFSRDGSVLVYCVATKQEKEKEKKEKESEVSSGGVHVLAAPFTSLPFPLQTGPGRYSHLTWDEQQGQLAFLRSLPPASPASGPPVVTMHHWKRKASEVGRMVLPSPAWTSPAAGGLGGLTLIAVTASSFSAADELKPAGKANFLPGETISDQGSLTFSKDGDRLYFNVAPPRPKAEPAPKGTEEKAAVELWHYQDGFIMPMQKVRYGRDQQASHRAVFRLTDRTCRQLADDRLSEVFPAPAGDQDLGMDDRPYRLLVGREAAAAADYYLLDTRDGSRKLILKKQTSPVTWSQGGNYLLFYNGKNWHSLAVATGQIVNLTASLKVPFFHEHHDQPGPAPTYGVGGWTAGDKQVLLYDRYDIWAVSPDGKGARNLTGGLGRKSTSALRIVPLTPRPAALDPAKPLLVRAHNETTEDTGFYRVSLDGGSPRLLMMGARNYSTPVQARRSDKLSLTVSTFFDCPEVYTTDLEFRELRKETTFNAQKSAFVWGKSELVRYRSADGVPLQGVLIKPENYQPGRKYPLIVYIYERLSDRLHVFVEPRPGTSINPSYYASNGYLVLMPDIAYTVGYPGQSALKCVLPAIQAVVDQGCVREDAIGLQGHSWGGYQTAYLITQTTRFKAAAAGAPVVNMTSAYGGIRWGTGLSRQFQYEHTQSRIGGTLWQYPTRFLENSPLFQADRIKTPLLMLHNDQDEAVPWQQGIEYYLALRRLGKEVYLFNYPGEGHGLRRRANMADYTTRMQQFFDHHLKGAPKPAWMEKGLPYSPPAGERTSPRPMGPEME